MALLKGLYRHPVTGFVCHEVYSLDDLIACNGMMITHGSWWQWMVGRDFHDFITQSRNAGVSTLAQLAANINEVGFRTLCIGTAGDVNYERPYAQRYSATKDAASVRVWGLTSNLDCGFGQSAKTLLGAGNGKSLGHASGNTSFYWANGGKGIDTIPALYNGSGAIRIPMNMTYGQLLDRLGQGIPDSSRSEVAERLVAARARVLALLAGLGVSETMQVPLFVPFLIRRNGRVAYVPPKRDQMLTAVVGSNNMSNANSGNYTNNYKGVRSLGARAVMADGRGVCVPPFICASSTRGGYHAGDNLASTGGDYSAKFLAMPSTYLEDTFPLIDYVDGIRVERILLGVTGNRLSDTAEMDPISNVNLSSQSVWDDYWSKVNVELGAMPTKTGVGASQESDAAFASRLDGVYAATPRNTMRELTLTNYDTFGMTAGAC